MSALPTIPPEEQYLLHCGQAILASVDGSAAAAPPPGLDWERLLHRARRTRLFPQLHRCLRSHQASVPEPVWQTLESLSASLGRRNRILTDELLDLVEYFARAGCPVLPYKGPVLAAIAYGDITLRQFSDLDLLIPRRAAQQASELLQARGYRLQHHSPRAAEAVHLGTEYHYLFRHPASGIAVELHGEAIPCYFSFPLTNEELWERREEVVLCGRSIPSLSREDLVLLLAMHGTKHEWECMELVLGLSAVLQASPDLRCESLLQRATVMGARRILLLGLSLAQQFFGYRLPPLIASAIDGDPMVSRLTAQVWEYYLGVRQPGTSALQTTLFQSRSRERRTDRIRYWLRKVLAPNWEEIEWLPLPRALFRLYWLLRPVRLIAHYGPEILGLSPPRATRRHPH